MRFLSVIAKFTVLSLAAFGVASGQDQAQVNETEVAEGAQPKVTDGECQIDVRLQAEGETPIGVPTGWHPDNNIIVKLAASDCDVAVSPTWTVAGWNMTIVQIAPNSVFEPPAIGDDERHLIKIIRGTLIDVNVNGIFDGEHWETYTVTPPNRAISMYIDSAVDKFNAGDEGAVIVYFKVMGDVPIEPITDMTASPATDIAGPFSEYLTWNKYADITPPSWGFEGVEFYNLAGILVQENDGSRLVNMQFWTLREDFNADNYHDHSDLNKTNAFAEIHMAMYAANGVSGMQTTLMGTENLNYKQNPVDTGIGNSYNQNNQTEVQIAIPMPPGFAHGPLWSVDPATGEPTLMCSGGVMYPYHRWLISANGEPNDPLRYSMWVAFEHLPKDVTVPQKMLTEWPNANLQNTMTEADCESTEEAETPPVAASAGVSCYFPFTLAAIAIASFIVAIP